MKSKCMRPRQISRSKLKNHTSFIKSWNSFRISLSDPCLHYSPFRPQSAVQPIDEYACLYHIDEYMPRRYPIDECMRCHHLPSSSSQQMCRPSCQTSMQLFYSTLASSSFSWGLQSRSSTFDLWPMCLNRQLVSCSFLSFEMSQMSTFRPQPQEASTHELNGLHCTLMMLFFSPLKVMRDLVKFRMSHTDTFSSAEPLANRNSLKGEKSSEQTSSVWATTSKSGFLSSFAEELLNLTSQMLMRRSSEQEAKMLGWNLCQATSSIGAL